jgi:putative spermidine/putrescine transport system substrate-binding protein/spermidine/putrescine transport system substrate-binding protein
MFAAIQAGGTYDLVSASNDLTQRLVDADLVQEIDTSKLTNYGQLFEQFQRPDYITFDDKLYGVNFAWGPTYLIYDPDAIATAPTSWNALFDEQYEGKIATWDNAIQIAQYALLLDPKPEDPYVLTDDQLAQIKDLLVAQRPLLRFYWSTGTDLAEAWANKEIVIADGWPWITLTIRGSGTDAKVAEVLPAEGVTGWSDSWMIAKDAQNVDLAYTWADYMIGEQGQMGIVDAVNYSITNQVVAEQLPPERQAELRLTDVAAEYAKILMWRNVANYDKWLQVWQEATKG